MSTFEDYPSLTLKGLLEAASEKDELAARELGRRYNGKVCAVTLSQLKRQGCNLLFDHSPEIVREAWFKILVCASKQLKDYESFEGWFASIITRLVSHHVKGPNGCISQQNRTDQLDPMAYREPTRAARITPTHKLIEASLWVKEVIVLAYKMDFTFGEIVRLHHVEGYPLEKVAEMLDQPYAKVRSYYYRKLEKFRKYIKVKGEDDSKDDDDQSGGGGNDTRVN